jgi:hypothetical protein
MSRPPPRTVLHRLAPKGPTRLEREMCPDCGCCTLALDDWVHWYDAHLGIWICNCPGYQDLAESDQ